ncbi:MAG: hypothetical protein ACU0BF_00800 [Paracoccaceae bacterium]
MSTPAIGTNANLNRLMTTGFDAKNVEGARKEFAAGIASGSIDRQAALDLVKDLPRSVLSPEVLRDMAAKTDNAEAKAILTDLIETLESGISALQTTLEEVLSRVSNSSDLGKLLIEMASMGREQALDQRLAARDAAKADQLSQADATREAGQKAMQGALASMVVSAVSAGVTIGATAKSTAQSVEGLKMNKTAAIEKGGAEIDMIEAKQWQAKPDAIESELGGLMAENAIDRSTAATQLGKEGDMLMQKGQAMMTNAQAMGQALNGVGGLASGSMQAQAANIEAEGQVDAANAQEEMSNVELAKKVMDDMSEMVRAALDFLRKMEQTEAEMMQNFTRV